MNTVLGDLKNHMSAQGMEAIAYANSGSVMLYGMENGEDAAGAIEACFTTAHQAGGSAVLESGPVALRRQVNVWGPPRPEWEFTRNIKKTFDPAGILNRGRYVGGI